MVLFVAALLVLAVAAPGLCGPPVGAGEAGRAGMPGAGGAYPGAAPGGEAAAQGAISGLTVTPGGGLGGSSGSGSGSPALLVSSIGTKTSFVSVQRAAYTFPSDKFKVRIFGDAVNNSITASGRYNEASGNQIIGADRRNGHELDVTMTVGLYNLNAQLGYVPTGRYTKNIAMGPMIGVQKYVDKFEVTDNTTTALSSDGTHSATLFTLGAWGEVDISGLFGGLTGGAAGGKFQGSKLYLSAMGGLGKDWTSFNWEALVTVWSAAKGSYFSNSRYGKYIPALSTQVGYIGYYFTQSRQDETSSTFLVPGALSTALDENVKVDFGSFVVRVSGTF
ncbi:MAG: hypothetical protein AB1646_15960 [Thermodesulfobacteriota bacterium]